MGVHIISRSQRQGGHFVGEDEESTRSFIDSNTITGLEGVDVLAVRIPEDNDKNPFVEIVNQISLPVSKKREKRRIIKAAYRKRAVRYHPGQSGAYEQCI